MKNTTILFLCFLIISCQKSHYIYLVRHAEKVDNSRDPDLSELGKKRAEKLAEILGNQKIEVIYSTNYKRTQQTATPIAALVKADIQSYAADSTMSLFGKKLITNRKNALVVGHSNTTISMLDALGVKGKVTKIADEDYGNLFKVKVQGIKITLMEGRY